MYQNIKSKINTSEGPSVIEKRDYVQAPELSSQF